MKRLFLAPVLLLAGLSLAQETGYSTSWSGHRTLHVNTSPIGGTTISANVLKFPSLVRLTAADSAVFAASKGSGADIRFTKSNNTTRLKHQIDRWDSAGRKAEIWVLLDTVYANNSSQNIRMHYGNATAADSSNGAVVFDSANGFIATWHLGGSSPTADRANAVKGGNPAVPTALGSFATGAFPSGREGMIGLADTLRRGPGTSQQQRDSSDHFNLGVGYNNFNNQLTFSGWFYSVTGSNNDWQQYISLGNGAAVDNLWMGRQGSSANNFMAEVNGGNGNQMTGGTIARDAWSHLVWTINGTASNLYVNGTLAGARISSTLIKDTTRVFNYIGRSNWPDRNVPGKFDEIRIAKVARSADWVALEYANQNAAQTLVTPPTAPLIGYSADSVSAEAGFPIAAIIPSTLSGTPSATLSISPALSTGLSFNATTGAITGTVAAAAAKKKYTVTATNTSGSTTDSIWITITAPAVTEDYTTWTGTKTLSLNGAALGISNAVSRIPVLVRLAPVDSAIFKAGRASLRFSKADGSKLKYAIDSWDSLGRSASVWVLYDNVTTGTNSLRLHWGKAGAISQSSGPSVFEPANGYVGVYHMGNPIDTANASTSARPNEARPGINVATPVNMTTISPVKPGVIGMADSLPGLPTTGTTAANVSGFSLDTLPTGTFPTGNVTFSTWMQQADGGSVWRAAISMGNSVGCCGNVSDGVLVGSSGTGARRLGYQVATRIGTDGNPTWPSTANNAIETDSWFYVALTIRAGTTNNDGLYLNGIKVATTGGGDREVRDTTRSYNSLGRNVFAGDASLRGMLDEARIANVSRSDDWFKVEYNTQKPGVMPVASVAYTAATNYLPGTAITSLTPVVVGSAAMFSVSPALPAGLSIDNLTGVISGTPTASAPSAAYVVTASNGPWSATSTVTFSVAAGDGAYASAWSGHKYVNLNTTGTTAGNNARKFPLLVRLGTADSAIFNASQTSGADIRFTKLNNTTRLQHEIEMWDKAANRAAVWVLVDTAYTSATGSVLIMHYGNATVGDSSNPSAVFDSASYLGVWHMGNVPTNTTPRPNAVAGGFPATPAASTANLASGFIPSAGVIGMADTLRGQASGTNATARGNDDHFSLGNSGYIFTNGQVTMSLWLLLPPAFPGTSYHHFLTFGNGTNAADNIWMGRIGSTNTFAQRSATSTGESSAMESPDALAPLGEWANFTITRDGTNGQHAVSYKNGVSILDVPAGDATLDINAVSRTMNFIGRSNWADQNIRAKFDEVRVLKTSRSADWVKLEYLNQNPASTMVTFSNSLVARVVGINTASALTLGAPALGFKAVGQGLLFQVQSPASSKVRLSIVDMFGRTVWNNTVQTTAGMNQISWNGSSNNGQGIGAGIYVVRMNLLDAQGKSVATLNSKVPLTH